MLVGVSTGVLHPHITGINKQIRFFRESGLRIDGIELSFAKPEKPNRSGKVIVKLTKKNESYIKQLNFNSIHLPWKEIVYSEKGDLFINSLSELYHRLDSHTAVIHPDCVKTINTYGFIQKLFPNLSVENMTPEKSSGCSIKELMHITNRNPKIGIVLDFAHSMESQESFEMYEKAFYQRIAEIHISASRRAFYCDTIRQRHITLNKTGIVPTIRKKDVPLIIEGEIYTAEELEREIKIVRKL
ncbi:Uncharacterised protein [uncultured archaeon]|nr:Uncharacterised protein [uncultured archaeon]